MIPAPITADVIIPLLIFAVAKLAVPLFCIVTKVAVSVILIAVAAIPVLSILTVFRPTYEPSPVSLTAKEFAVTAPPTLTPKELIVVIPAIFAVSYKIAF